VIKEEFAPYTISQTRDEGEIFGIKFEIENN
jgi:hypothetical protein